MRLSYFQEMSSRTVKKCAALQPVFTSYKLLEIERVLLLCGRAAMYIGYARVSTQDQNLDLQHDALQQVGCKKIIVDRVSGTVAERPGLRQIKDLVREGDTLVVWRLDRLGRSIKDLIAWVHWLRAGGGWPEESARSD